MSSSSSSQSAKTYQTDNRRVLGEGALSAENSTVYQTTVTNTLDADVANKAMDTARLSAGQALDFAGGSLDGALGFGSKALTTTSNSLSDALNAALSFGQAAAVRENNVLDKTTTVLSDAYADAKGRGALTDKILIGVVIMAGVIAVMALKK